MKKLLSFILPSLVFFLSISLLSDQSARGNLEFTAKSAQRAALQCYAIEGAYPESADELKKYGFLGGEHCIVHYACAGANLMPHIEILETE